MLCHRVDQMETKGKLLLSTSLFRAEQNLSASSTKLFSFIFIPYQNGAVCTAGTHIENIQACDLVQGVRDTTRVAEGLLWLQS